MYWNHPCTRGQDDAFLSIEKACEALKNNEIDVLVTAPINKYNIQADDYKFAGHTDYLNEQLEGEALMFMVHEDIKVGLITDHIPIAELSKHINTTLIEKKITNLGKFKTLNIQRIVTKDVSDSSSESLLGLVTHRAAERSAAAPSCPCLRWRQALRWRRRYLLHLGLECLQPHPRRTVLDSTRLEPSRQMGRQPAPQGAWLGRLSQRSRRLER